MAASPAVFLDRDGTILHDVSYLSRREDVHWYPFAVDAIRLLKRAGFRVCVVTNQGGVGLGFFTEAFVRQTHAEMAAELEAAGATIDGWYYCPHHPRAKLAEYLVDCDCRKPKAGMVRQAARDFELDLARSFVVGDKPDDVGLAGSIGARAVFVTTGHGGAELARHGGTMPGAAHIAADLMEATAWILRASNV